MKHMGCAASDVGFPEKPSAVAACLSAPRMSGLSIGNRAFRRS